MTMTEDNVLTVDAMTKIESIAIYNCDAQPRDYEVSYTSGSDRTLLFKKSTRRWSQIVHNCDIDLVPGDSIIVKTDAGDYRVSFMSVSL